MHYSKLTMLIPCTLLLSACTTVTPAYKDNSTHSGPCIEGGPDNMAQQFYDYHILHHSNNITTLHPYLSNKLATLLSNASQDNNHQELLTNNPFSSQTTLPDSTHIASASTIPNHDAHNIPLHVDLKQGDQGWQDEVLMIQEGQCWVINNVHYLGSSIHATAGTLHQSIKNH